MFKIKVPATSANLGPGFDVMGLAIDRYNTFNFKIGETFPEDNLIYKSYRSVFEYLNKDMITVEITVDEDVPRARGLGSSATCIVGGIMGANEILENPLNKEEILKLASKIEGHPDNVAPAIYGGLVASVVEGNKIHTGNIPIKNDLIFIALVPNFELSTSQAREVLPKEIPHDLGVYNVGRASMLISGLIRGDNSLLKIGLADKLHQPYRGKLIEGFDDIISKSYDSGSLGCYLSGAGPTIMCIGEEGDSQLIDKIQKFMDKEYENWKVFVHKIDETGAIVIER